MGIYEDIDYLFAQEEAQAYTTEAFEFKTRQTFDSKEMVFKSENLKNTIKKIKEFAQNKKWDIMTVDQCKKLIKAEAVELNYNITPTKECAIEFRVVDGVTIIATDINFIPGANAFDNIGNMLPIIGWIKKLFKVDKFYKQQSQKHLAKKGLRLLILCVYFETHKKGYKTTVKKPKLIGRAYYKINQNGIK